MQPLHKILSALRREILDALENNRDLPDGSRLQAEKVVVSLGFSVNQHSPDGAVEVSCQETDLSIPDAEARAAKPVHQVTIQFRIAPAPAATELSPSFRETAFASPQPADLERAQDTKVAESLSSIFGAPSFDSSARATVFREALAGLSDDQARAIINSLRGLPTPGISPAAARARHLIGRLLERGHAGAPRGRDILSEILHQHSVQSVIRIVRERWKTQEDWLDD
jgi:hypothetical protein